MRDTSIPTTEKLARALEQAQAPYEMILKAREGYYDDYKSPIVDNIGALVHDARAAGLGAIALRAIDGEFDGTKEEANEWQRSPEGQEIFNQVMNNTRLQGANRAARRKKNGN